MKHIIPILACLLLLTSCHNDTKQIQTAAMGYLNAMGNYRPTDARPYSTQETCDITLTYFEEVMKHTTPSVYANNMPATITLGEIEIEDTTAVINFHKSTPSVQQDGQIHLLKRNKQWLVHEVIQIPSIAQMNVKPQILPKEEIESIRQQQAKEKSNNR